MLQPVAPLRNTPTALDGVERVWYIAERESIMKLPRLRRWLIRLVYAKSRWASDYRIRSKGVYVDLEEARAVAQAGSLRTGNQWSVKELPVNAYLPDEECAFGFYTFPNSDADDLYRTRPLDVVHLQDVRGLKVEARRLGKIFTDTPVT